MSGNTNCLEGLACPKCGQDERLFITGSAVFEIVDAVAQDLEDAEYSMVEYDSNSPTACGNTACDFEGDLGDFRVKEVAKATMPTITPADFVEIVTEAEDSAAMVSEVAARLKIELCESCLNEYGGVAIAMQVLDETPLCAECVKEYRAELKRLGVEKEIAQLQATLKELGA